MNHESVTDQPSTRSVSDHHSSGRDCGAPACQSHAHASQHASEALSSSSGAKSSKTYWRSIDELADSPQFREFVNREFPASASEMLDSNQRRQFLKLMGASMALAGVTSLAGCRRWPEEKIAPYANRPAGHAPGSTDQFATCMELGGPAGGVAAGLLVTSYDYRPIKIEGNPEHPTNQGATDAIMQASILDLYDPDRSQSPLNQGKKADWAGFLAWCKSQRESLGATRGGGLSILCEATSSPSVAAMKQRLQKALPNAKWHEYEPLSNDNVIKGSAMAFGSAHRAQYAFDKAKTIVSLDFDFLSTAGGGPQALRWTRDFIATRKAEDRKTMSRLYVFESTPSITGTNADHRVSMRSADIAMVAATMAKALSGAEAGDTSEIVSRAIADLKASRGASIVLAGPRQPAEVHYLAHLMNELLGNVGQTVTYTALPDAVAHLDSLKALASDLGSGNVQLLVMIGGNPAYNAPVDMNFADLIKKARASVHLSEYVDETSQLCTWHVNRAHYLETWGDGRAYDGTITLGQPLIEALFQGKSAVELLAVIAGDELTNGLDIVRRTIREMGSGMDFESFWRKSLHDGFIAGTATQPVTPRVKADGMNAAAQAIEQAAGAAGKGDDLELVFAPDYAVYDGRFANNGWLQEMPDPIVKLTWDNAALISPALAKARGLSTGDMVTIKGNGREVTAPVMLLPGQNAGTVTVVLGYGRDMNGRICKGAGFNFYKLRTSDGMNAAKGASLAKASGHYLLATTQDHFPIDSVGGQGTQDRLPTLLREGTLAEYQEHPTFAKHRTHVVHRLSLFEERQSFHHEGQNAQYAWAMSIDLNACTGCNACVIACQAENNIPIVGKDQVSRGREMHWIRVDRYFKGGSEENPEAIIHAPVPCMQCENAPCEQVCPVAATTHDEQGLNVMVYNRCVGTRYCSNNCPYKVRKFNYFDFHVRGPLREQPGMLLQVEPDYYTKGQAQADPLKQLQFNPEVTVRMRGIMEKCTYCIQRITKARIDAKNAWVKKRDLDPNAPLDQRIPIPDGTITPACAQACPGRAIVFGDLNDPNSRVAKLHKHERTYEMLEELNTKPRTRYMARLRNPAISNGAGAAHGEGGHG